MDDGEEGQYVHYGQPLEREEDLSRKKAKLVVDLGQARRLPPWKQEVTDAEGRRRFHGAFSGGFSAGYYNTVGSKEGWAPKTFSSSRNRRAQTTQQSIDDFLDEDELEEARLKGLATSAEYDTFGFTAAEIARRNAEKEVGKRPSAIPGPVPDEIVIPATQSIGVKLLMKMGWRRGRVVGPRHFTAISVARREGRKAAMAFASSSHTDDQPKKLYGAQLPPNFVSSAESMVEVDEEDEEEIDVSENIPDFVLHPKSDVFGLGFDPLKNAPEFKELKQARNIKDNRIWMPGRVKDSRDASGRVRNMASQFGSGGMDYFHDDDEETYDTVAGDIEDKDEDAMKIDKPQPRQLSNEDCIPGFAPATISSLQMKPARIPLPVVPIDFDTKITFATSLDTERSLSIIEPPEGQPPSDPDVAKLIDGLAAFVARMGPRFEEISKEKHAGNPQFSFLVEGPGHDYYRRKLWEEQRNLAERGSEPIEPKRVGQIEKLGAGQRGLILGETPLPKEEKARMQEALARNFTSSVTKAVDTIQAKLFFSDDPKKQERFESFLKEKLVGGIKRRSGEGINMSRAQYELEMCEFDNAFRSLEAGGATTALSQQPKEVSELTAMMVSRFTAGSVETSLAPSSEPGSSGKHGGSPVHEYPRREENPWRPSALLCKRFNLMDPFAGKPPSVTKPRSQTESFVLNIASVVESTAVVSASTTLSGDSPAMRDVPQVSEEETKPVKTITEKPVDLYKAIFSDEDEDDEGVGGDKESSLELPAQLFVGQEYGEKEVIAKQSEAAQAALNRLAAGDFLESLGKELGLRVPAEKPRVEPKMNKGANRLASSDVGVAEVSDKPDSEKNHLDVNKKNSVDKIDKRDKVSRWEPVVHGSVLGQIRSMEQTSIGREPAISVAAEHFSRSVEAEPGFHKRMHAPSKSSSSSSSSQDEGDSESEEKKSRRHCRRSRQDNDSDIDSGRRRSRRPSKRSGQDSDTSYDSARGRSKRHSKKSRRAKDERDSRRHRKRRHEKHKRKEDDRDGRKKSRHHRDDEKTSTEL